MKCILMNQGEYDDWVLDSGDAPVFNEQDEYRFYKEFDGFHSRDQIRVEVENYIAQLKAIT